MERFYRDWRIVRMTNKGKMIVRRLFEEYLLHPEILPPEVAEGYNKQGLGKEGQKRLLADYVAGMTDRYATAEYLRLFEVGHPA